MSAVPERRLNRQVAATSILGDHNGRVPRAGIFAVNEMVSP
jgi:hypothetical protein